MAKARWYDSWISASRRETASLPSLSPTHVASLHQRQESKTTVNLEDAQDQSQTISTSTKTRTKCAPKPLSLVERFDLADPSPPMPSPTPMPVPATASVPMPVPHPASPPLTKVKAASSITQEEEPLLSHREEIDNRVKSWRASATFKTNLLASTGQVSLDPANMPNTLPLDYPVAEDDEVRSEMNPEDYSWSITSPGPPSVLNSPPSSYRVQSVHMDRRLIGSVPLTPETCTSWGPEDYDPLSPVSSEFRLPSPDLGQRNLEYCPMTPTTATSWGPPSEYPPSPDPDSQWAYHYRAPSLDLGQRAGWSRPVTPSTATSWGPPEEWPPTPTTLSRVSTPDPAQQRFSFTEEIGGLAPRPTVIVPASPVPWKLVWPYLMPDEQTTRPQELAPWKFVWPYLTLDEQKSKSQEPVPWNYVWPYLMYDEQTTKTQDPAPWNYVWPYLTQAASPSGSLESLEPLVVVRRAAYPVFNICGLFLPLPLLFGCLRFELVHRSCCVPPFQHLPFSPG